MSPPRSLAEAKACDAADPVSRAEAFALPADLTYLVGHSLGPATHHALDRLKETAACAWAQGLVRSWNAAGWTELAAATGARIAPLIGARPSEVIVTDSVSVNLFKLAAAALPLARDREIVVEADEFPTDIYVAEGLAALVGASIRTLAPGEVSTAGGVWIKSLVNYRTAALADMAAHEKAARRSGGVIVWDLSHAAGAVAVDLAAAGARLAVGCCYKYLNGGPGAPGYIFVADGIAARLANPIAGWFGHAEPFAFANAYSPMPGAARFAAGTPPILSLAALEASLEVFEGLDGATLAAKAQALGALVIDRAQAIGIPVLTHGPRGAHIALQHTEGYAIVQALAERGVLADFRPPDTIRLGLSPLYVSFTQVWTAMDAMADIVRSGAHRDPRFAVKAKVT